jgi:DNA primase
MTDMEDAKEEIRARLPIEDVVGRYVELKRAGRNMKGLSPWTNERTPSFMVSPEKGIWHDFSANKGGDIFAFLMDVAGVSFRDALETRGGWAGVELKTYGDGRSAARKKRALAANELACKFFQLALTKNKRVAEYVFYKRNLNRKTVEEFRIGYAPAQGKVLVELMQRKGFTAEELADGGLVNRFGGDLFRGRMTVPLMDAMGVVIGFTARLVEDVKDAPKYLNTPETVLYNKSRHIFGLSQAKEAIRKNGFAVVVEGNMDVISSHQAGVKETVATGGTAMTELHLKELARRTKDIRLAYDGDAAGVAAAERAIMLAGGLGIALSVVSDYQGCKDPDELIQKGPELWQAAVAAAVPAVDWLLDKYAERLDVSSARGKREFSDVAVKLLGYIKDPVEHEHYEQEVARRLGVSVEALRNKEVVRDGDASKYGRASANRYSRRPDTLANLSSQTSKPSAELLSRADSAVPNPLEDKLISILLMREKLRGQVQVEELMGVYHRTAVERGFAIDKTEGDLYTWAQVRRLEFEGRYGGWTDSDLAEEIKGLKTAINKQKLKQQKTALQRKLADAELMGDEAKVKDLLGAINKLNREG